MNIRNIVRVNATMIDCEYEHPDYGWIPFTATNKAEDSQLSRDVYAEATSGAYGAIPDRVFSVEEIKTLIVTAVQMRLDDFARTRGYDNILSACTYATSTVPKFQAEGQYCVDARDSTWATLYTLLAQVEAGTAPMPNSYADVESLLPPLVWPSQQ